MADDGIVLLKYWLEVSSEEQTRRLESRIHDPAPHRPSFPAEGLLLAEPPDAGTGTRSVELEFHRPARRVRSRPFRQQSPFEESVAAPMGTVLASSGGPVLCRASGEDGPRWVDDALQEPDLDGALDRLAT
jgi:hypothetical protein